MFENILICSEENFLVASAFTRGRAEVLLPPPRGIPPTGMYGQRLKAGVKGKNVWNVFLVIAVCIMHVFGMSSCNPYEGQGDISLREEG